MKKFKEFQTEEMNHHDKEAKFYAKRNEEDYIWEVPAKEFLFFPKYIKQESTVVDMGCGPAILIKNILPRNLIRSINYIGVDISKNMLKFAKSNIPSGRFLHDDMETVKIKRNSADVIVSLGALHHSQNKIKTLKNWFSILKPNGVILMREPTKDSLKRGSGESPNEEGVDILDLKKFAKSNNATIVKIEYFWSPLFHLVNRILIKLGFGSWRTSKKLWKIVLYADKYVLTVLNSLNNKFKGDSVAIVLRKNESIN